MTAEFHEPANAPADDFSFPPYIQIEPREIVRLDFGQAYVRWNGKRYHLWPNEENGFNFKMQPVTLFVSGQMSKLYYIDTDNPYYEPELDL